MHLPLRRSLAAAAVVAICLPFAAHAAGSLDGFDEFMARAMATFKVPGVAVAVVKDGKLILVKGYGYRDVERKLPITGNTIFPIASITKSFTVTGLGTLADEGKLDWDKPVREYFPEFRMYDPVATEQLTIRDMVTHRTGLPRHDLVWYSSSFTRQQLFDRLRYLEPNKPIRSTFQYNNLMFMTAGFLGGRMAGGTWEDLVQHRILDPLGMSNTKFSSDDARKTPDYALPYRKNWKTEDVKAIEFARWGDVGPAGAINSCLDDMAKYLVMHVNKGTAGGKQILGRNNSAQMQLPQMVIQSSPLFSEMSETAYGMGLFIETYRGHKHVYHGGNLDGFSLQFSMLPNDGLGVIVLTNLDGTSLRDLVPYAVYDRLLGLDPIDWASRYHGIEEKARAQQLAAESKGYTGRKEGTHPSHELADYTGEFEHPGYGTVVIRLDSSGAAPKLFAKLNDVERPLEHFHYDTFQVPENPLDAFEKLRLTFPTNAQGEIATLQASLETSVKEIVFTRQPEKRMFDVSFLRRMAGEYEGPARPLVIEVADKGLQVVSPGAPARKLIPRHGTRFELDGAPGVFYEFKLDGSGPAAELVIYTPDSAFVRPRKQ